MRILSIGGENLASLDGEFRVELDGAPLANAGLFAITGPTGAGKSTLLDALCLALYGDTPRMDRRGKASYRIGTEAEDPKERLTHTDVRQILRRGRAECIAEVEFLGSDGRRYRARWSVRRARDRPDGRLQSPRLLLWDLEKGAPLSGNSKEETRQLIEEKIGLDFDQFRRSVLLAQGEFAAFLQANRADRAALLERMTGTELFARISRLAYQKTKEETEKLAAMEARLAAIELLDEEDRARLETEWADAGREAKAAQDEAAAMGRAVAFFEREAKLRTARDEARRDHHTRHEAWLAMAPRREKLERVRAVQPLRGYWEAAVAAAASLETATRREAEARTQADQRHAALAETRKAAAAAEQVLATAREEWEARGDELEQARRLDAVLEEKRAAASEAKTAMDRAESIWRTAREEGQALVARLDALRAQTKSLADWCEAHRRRQDWIAAWPHWRDLLTQLEREIQDEAGLQSRGAELAKAVDAAERALVHERKDRERLDAAWQRARAALERAKRDAEDIDLDAVDRRCEALERDVNHAAEDLAHIDGLLALDGQLTEVGERLAALRESMAATAESQTGLARENELDAARLQEARATAERLTAALDLADRRALLVADEPCPLCGSRDHPYREAAPPPDHVEAQRQRVVTLEKRLQASREEAAACAARLQADGERRTRLESEAAKLKASRAEACRYPRAAQLDPGDREELSASLTSLREDLALARERAKSARVRAAALQRANQALAELEEPRALAADRLASCQAKFDETRREQARQELEVQALVGRRDRLLRDLAPLAENDRDGALLARGEFAPVCEERRNQWLDRAGRLERLETEVAEMERHWEAAQREGAHREDLYRERREQFESLHREREALTSERGALLGGEAVTEVARRHKDRLARMARELDLAREALATSEREEAAARERLTDQVARLEEARAAVTAADRRLTHALAEADISRADLEVLAGHDPAWIEAESAELDAAERAWRAAETELAARQRQLDAHREDDPPAVGREEAAAARDEAEARLTAIRERVARLQAALARDDDNRAQVAERTPELATQRDIADSWRQLDALIGSADGGKFRQIAQGLTLAMLLAHANRHLRDLEPRYRLEQVPGYEMDLQVADTYMGDQVRAVGSLSGGETFLVSLSLALALSSLSSAGTRIGSLFIDEGFGTLDEETLETALAVLDALQAQGRQVGLISHVPGIAERIGTRIELVRTSQDSSRIKVVSAGEGGDGG